MSQTDQQADEAFRDQCRRQMACPLAWRIKYGFNRVYKPALADAPWCGANLPVHLGFKLAK